MLRLFKALHDLSQIVGKARLHLPAFASCRPNPLRLQILRHNAIEAWQTMQKTSCRRCPAPSALIRSGRRPSEPQRECPQAFARTAAHLLGLKGNPIVFFYAALDMSRDSLCHDRVAFKANADGAPINLHSHQSKGSAASKNRKGLTSSISFADNFFAYFHAACLARQSPLGLHYILDLFVT